MPRFLEERFLLIAFFQISNLELRSTGIYTASLTVPCALTKGQILKHNITSNVFGLNDAILNIWMWSKEALKRKQNTLRGPLTYRTQRL